MKKSLLFIALLFAAAFAKAQTEVTIPMLPNYANQVYYKFSTNTQTPAAASSWDIAIEKAPGMMSLGGIRANDGRGIRVFQAGAETAWADVDITEEAEWTEVYNSETDWSIGAFDEGTATYGWGEYNLNGDHHVTGTVTFVLKYAATAYKKVIIEDYNPYVSTITFKYSTWDSTTSAWGADQTYVVDNAALATGYSWNYLSLDTNNTVTVAPADADWDLVFRRYYGNIGTDDAPMMYYVTGVLQNANVTVAQVAEAGTVENPAVPQVESDAYSDEINTIGDDWKSYTGGTYVIADNAFYIKSGNSVYRIYFTNFAGQGTGNVTFNAQDVTTLSVDDVVGNLSFGLYPNPSTDKNVTLLYDLQNGSDKNLVSIYNLSGAKVYETEVSNNTGFYSTNLNLSNLSAGVYVVKMQAGAASVTQKLILQ